MFNLLLILAIVLPCYGTSCPKPPHHGHGSGSNMNSIVNGDAAKANKVGL